MKFIRLLLFPIMPIYYIVTWCRNKFYDLGFFSSKSYNFPLICVGNLSTGGTGKTPMVEYLITLLKKDYNLATLSRGYGRKTKGYLLASSTTDAKALGDEPFQFYNKYKNSIIVAVDENRQNGIYNLRNLKSQPDLIVLDDAFQHRKVKAKLNILLTTYSNLYYKDLVLPTGNLREPRSGANRAQLIVVTKCPTNLSLKKKKTIITKLKPKKQQKVFFSSINYAKKVVGKHKSINLSELEAFTLVTGIANAKPLVSFLINEGLSFNHLEYSDHHDFSKTEVNTLSKHKLIVTTEKDYVRLTTEKLLSNNLYYIPITINIDRPDDFNTLVRTKISN